MSSPGTVDGDERVRLFLALELPADVTVELVRWGKEHLSGGREPELPRHARLLRDPAKNGAR